MDTAPDAPVYQEPLARDYGSQDAEMTLRDGPLTLFFWFTFAGIFTAVQFTFHHETWVNLEIASAAWLGVVAITLFTALIGGIRIPDIKWSGWGKALAWFLAAATIAIPIIVGVNTDEGGAVTFTVMWAVSWMILLPAFFATFKRVSARSAETKGRFFPSFGWAIGYTLAFVGWIAAMPVLSEYVVPFILEILDD